MKVLLIVLAIVFLVYLVLITPRIFHRPDTSLFDRRFFAHRGLHDNESEAPENSPAAFEKAVRAGYGIEMDVQLTKDHIPVVFHDFTTERMLGIPGKVLDYTYEELQRHPIGKSTQTVPKFEDVLRLVNGQVPLIIEIKVEKYDLSVMQPVLDLLSGYRGDFCIESFNPLALRWLKRKYPEIIRGQLAEVFCKDQLVSWLYFALTLLLFNVATKPDFIAYNHRDWKDISVLLIRHLYHLPMACWTVQTQEQLEKAVKHFDVFIFDSFVPDESVSRLR